MQDISQYVDIRTLEMLPNGIIIYHTVGDRAYLLYANRVALDIFECSSLEEMQEQCKGNYLNYFHPDDYKHHIDTINLAWHSEYDFDHHAQYRIITKNNNIKMLNDAGHSIEIPGYERCLLCDLTQLDRQVSYSYDASDNLTGLLSMGQFVQYAESFLNTPSNHADEKKYDMLYFNIRRFKEYNVQYGSQSGDQVLLNLSKAIVKKSTTKIVSRIGVDQFVCIAKPEELPTRIQNIIDKFQIAYESTGMLLKVGVYPISDHKQDIHEACDLAKIACDSIRNSLSSICIYNEELTKRKLQEIYVIQHLDDAIKNGYIKVFYQPVVRTLTGKICSYEALARWDDPTYGLLTPGVFIPVLENNGLITKLDMHILELICREMHEAQRRGEALLPVSFNVSRYDFLKIDCFAEVEKIVRKYGIARDMINIEITESMFMDNYELMQTEIVRFRKGGYQIWMDDFGSGYSSLNLLKDYKFDEIKLDMKFLSKFDEKSKRIIESVIMMAKNLGVQTLAEGVETWEQFDYLRSIGCEKVQGYLMSRPLPMAELKVQQSEKNIDLERRAWRTYYDKISATNFIIDRPLAIMQFDGQKFAFVYVNDVLNREWRNLGIHDLDIFYAGINNTDSALSKKFYDLQREIQTDGKPREILYAVKDNYLKIKVTCLAEHALHYAYLLEVFNLSNLENRNKSEKLDTVFRRMFSMYDSVYYIDFNNGHFENLVQGSSNAFAGAKEFHELKLIDSTKAGEVFIHPDERKLFNEFTDLTTLLERLRKARGGYLTQFFRTRTINGAYVWKAHTILHLPHVNSVIYCSSKVNLEQPGLFNRVLAEHIEETVSTAKDVFGRALRKVPFESRTIGLFWKNREGRFVGANQRFLEMHNIKDVTELIGKNNAEMAWNVDSEETREDYYNVLVNGVTLTNRRAKCIINGREHDVVVHLEPLYDGGNIIGILGSVFDLDALDNSADASAEIAAEENKLMPFGKLVNSLTDYVDGWNIRKENFAIVHIAMPEYQRGVNTYGEKIAKRMLAEMTEITLREYGKNCICARLYASDFVLVMHADDKAAVQARNERFLAKISSIHELAGYAATVNPMLHTYFADEVGDFSTSNTVEAGKPLLLEFFRNMLNLTGAKGES